MEDLQMRNIDNMPEMDDDFGVADAAERDLEEEDEEPFTPEPEVYSEEEEMVEAEEITDEEEQEEEGLYGEEEFYGEEEEEEEESVREEEKPDEMIERFHPMEELPVGEEEMISGEREMTSDEALELEVEEQDTKLAAKEEGWAKKVTDKVFRAVVKLSQRGVVQLVMIIVVILYTILGSLLFRMVEMQKDMDSRKKTIEYIGKMIDELYETAQDDTADYKIWELQLQEKLTDTSYELTAKDIWEDAMAAKKESTVWTMEQTVYFCFTIFTSIGYGDFAPVTDFGRILTIAYGVIGIPVVVVALGDFGNRLEKILERICVVLIKFYYLGRYRNLHMRPPIYFVWEISHFMDQCTISWGSCPKIQEEVDQKLAAKIQYFKKNIAAYEDFKVPSLAALAIFLAVVLIFTYYFSVQEEQEFFTSFYFVFVTLTSIGFGDITPSKMNLYVFNIFVMILLAAISFLYSVVGSGMKKSVGKVRSRLDKVFFDPSARIVAAIREPPVPLGNIERGPRLMQWLARLSPEIVKPGYFVPGVGYPKPRYRKPNKTIWQKLI